ncbi:MAG TPA: phytanoyl-CoA dioxygenase family protein [Chitinophagales bacterium]|nr:phytanoyl-CoA dioxygenase family protein [Chitinophagales bacterium]
MAVVVKKVFKDAVRQAEFARQGYVRLPAISASALRRMLEILEKYNRQHEMIDSGLVSTSHSNNRQLIEEVDGQIYAALQPYFDEHLCNYRFIFSNLLLKKCGPETATPPHQDASYVNELKDMMFSIWIPLTDTVPANGCMRFLPGSHLLPLNTRPAPTHPWPYKQVEDIIEENLIDLPLKAGEPVAFHGASIHASYPNMTGSIRPSVVMALSNDDAQWVYYYCKNHDTNLVEEYPMTKEDYLSYVKGTVPSNKPPLREFTLRPPSMRRFYLKYAPLRLLRLSLP